MELAEVLVYLQVVVWVFTELLLKPVPNPYVPKRELSSCSQWLQSWLKYTNDAFDNIPDTYYVESCPMRLLSSAPYSQQIKDHRGT
jgi:hypothetical protein